MKPPEFLKVLPADIGRVGCAGACVLALVRYATAVSDGRGREVIDGETWWRAGYADISASLGATRDAVRRVVVSLVESGDLEVCTPGASDGDQTRAYRLSEQGSDLPVGESAIPPTCQLADSPQGEPDSPRGYGESARGGMANPPGGYGESANSSSPYTELERTKEGEAFQREPLDVEVVDDPADDPPPDSSSADEAQPLEAKTVEPASREVVTQRNDGMDKATGQVVDEPASPDNLPAVNGTPKPDPRGTRLPDDWMPDRAVIEQMRAKHPDVDLKAVHEEFVDYWRGVPGARGRKLDWNATWRNQVRRAAGRQQPRRRHGSAVEDKINGWSAVEQRLTADEGGPW
ncbi:hypothetical protein [Mycobacterium marseillense]|uniref:Helix-turn-helix domain-containing protein n=1 Tax=Mycobacterium marseillense TaxID=701042 RepID=A0ABM7JAV6_9MYCO|nr:hypothetical protein [Mycobacterium marseillense]MCV7404511.1 hypothetical protein [Mycobacterium marseillense]ORA89774.1 hypothetical protein BST31_17520 [Mycobacterium marseillense]BBY10999.1 hypothetical protein MMARJ_17390 [Mycobacterium marseillense]